MTTERLSGRLVLGIRSALVLLFGLAGSFMVVLAAFAPHTTTVLIIGQLSPALVPRRADAQARSSPV